MEKNKKKILIVVDMQKDFTSGVLGNAECEGCCAGSGKGN